MKKIIDLIARRFGYVPIMETVELKAAIWFLEQEAQSKHKRIMDLEQTLARQDEAMDRARSVIASIPPEIREFLGASRAIAEEEVGSAAEGALKDFGIKSAMEATSRIRDAAAKMRSLRRKLDAVREMRKGRVVR